MVLPDFFEKSTFVTSGVISYLAKSVFSMVDASDSSSNVPPTIRYGKAIPGIVLHRTLGAELPVDFVPEPKFECRSDDDILGMDAEPPSNLPVEHLKFRRYFEIRLGLAPVGAWGKIGLVFDQRRVDELWNETKCRAYVPIWFWPQSNFKDSGWEIFDVYDRLPPPVGVLFAHYDYAAEVGGGWLRFKADVDELTPPYELSVDANNPDVPSEEYASLVGQDQRVEEVVPWTCKRYLSQKVDATYGSTAVKSPMGTLASRIEENLYSADEGDRFDTLLKKEVEHRCSLLEDCRQQRRHLVDENKRKLYSPVGHQGVKAMDVFIRQPSNRLTRSAAPEQAYRNGGCKAIKGQTSAVAVIAALVAEMHPLCAAHER